MTTIRTGRTPPTTTRGSGFRLKKYKDYLRGNSDSGIVNVLDHLGRRIVIFGNTGFQEVPYTEYGQRTAINTTWGQGARI